MSFTKKSLYTIESNISLNFAGLNTRVPSSLYWFASHPGSPNVGLMINGKASPQGPRPLPPHDVAVDPREEEAEENHRQHHHAYRHHVVKSILQLGVILARPWNPAHVHPKH